MTAYEIMPSLVGSEMCIRDSIWGFVNHQPVVNHFQQLKEIPAQTPLSVEISKDLKKRGMTFVGPTIIYAHMQAIGMVNDHQLHCYKRQQP